VELTIPPAANKYGHSHSFTVRLSPEQMREIQVIVQDREWGRHYKTISDFGRNALYAQAREVSKTSPGVIDTDLTDLMIHLVQQEAEHQRNVTSLEDAAVVLENHLTRGRTRDAQRLYLSMIGVRDRMPEGEMRDMSTEKLARYAHLRPQGVVSLDPAEAV
jgi:hypothetical protein